MRSAPLTVLLIGMYWVATAFAQPAPTSGKGDTDLPPGRYNWLIRNDCVETVRIALHLSTGQDRVTTTGWWSLRPGQELLVPANSELVAYFAVSGSESKFWSDPEQETFGIDRHRNFTFPGDGRRHGDTSVGFRWVSVLEEPHFHITCN